MANDVEITKGQAWESGGKGRVKPAAGVVGEAMHSKANAEVVQVLPDKTPQVQMPKTQYY